MHHAALRERSESIEKKQNLSPRSVGMETNMTLKPAKQDMMGCFTCPICNNLFDHATSISECIHTFCRKCIEDKLIQEKLKACPICNVDLGVAPLDKLRSDNAWDDLRLKVFKPKPKIVKTATRTVLISKQYSRKKKRPQSSLLATSAKVSTLPDQPTPDAPLEPEKLGTLPEPTPDAPLSPENLIEQMEAVTLNQRSSRPVLSFRRRPRKISRPKRHVTRLKPEQRHVEWKHAFPGFQSIEQDNGLAGASMRPNGKENQDEKSKECAEENQNTVFNPYKKHIVLLISDSETEKVYGEKPKNNVVEKQKNVSAPRKKISSAKKGKGKAYSPPALRPRRQSNMNGAGTSSQVAIPRGLEKKIGNKPVWFSLVAAPNQNTDRPLTQVAPDFVRVENGNLPVSFVKKYIVKKLSLESEEEVEIWLRQEPVCSTQSLSSLVDWWVRTTPVAERKSTMVGRSGAHYVMVLHYNRSHLVC